MTEPFSQDPPQFALPQYRPEPPDKSDSALGAAFRLENDVVNAVEYMQGRAQRPEADPDFNSIERGQQSDLWLEHGPTLARAQSDLEFNIIEGRIRREEKDRQTLASHGFGGFAAGMAAGLFSPTIFVPLVGPARGAKGVAQAFGLAAAAATAAEVPLVLNQYTRTGGEVFAGIAGGTVLGGLLGSAAVMLRKADFDVMARDLEPTTKPREDHVVVRSGDGSVIRIGEQRPLQAAPTTRVDIPRAYHGTPESALTRADISPSRGVEVRGVTFFSDSEDIADQYSFTREYGEIVGDEPGQVITAKLRFDNPLEVDMKGEVLDAIVGDAYIQQAIRGGKDGVIFRNAVDSVDGTGPPSTSYAVLDQKAIRDPNEIEESGSQATGAASVGAAGRNEQFVPTFLETLEDGSVVETPITDMVEPGAMKKGDPLGIARLASLMSPILRSINQFDSPLPSLTARRQMLSLSDAGVEIEGNQFGLVPSPEGTVEARVQYYQALIARAYEAQIAAYNKYITGVEAPDRGARIAQMARIETNTAPKGKLTFSEFKAAVVKAMNNGDESDIPEVAQLARTLRRDFYEPIQRAADEAAEMHGQARLYPELDGEIDKSYFTRIFSPEALHADRLGFVNKIAQHYEDTIAADFNRRITRELEAAEADQDYADILTMTREEADEALLEVTQTVKALGDPNRINPKLDTVTALRDQARDLINTRADELLQRQPESLRTDPETQKAMLRQAKKETAEEVEKLREDAALLEAQVAKETPSVVETKAAKARLRKKARAIRRSWGAIEGKRAEALRKIEQNEEMNLRALGRIENATKRWLTESAKLDETRLQASLDDLLAKLEKETGLIERGEARLRKQEESADFVPGEKYGLERLRQLGRELKAVKTARKAGEAVFFDRAKARAEVRAALDETMENVNRVNNKRAERNAVLRQNAKDLNPEDAAKEIEARRAMRDSRFERLDDQLREAGAEDVNARNKEFSFRNTARDMATQLANKITGETTRVAQLDLMPKMRGPMKRRVLDLPYDELKPWLDHDTEQVFARYAQSVGADIELFRMTGSKDGSAYMTALGEDLEKLDELIRTRETYTDAKGREQPVTDKLRDKQIKQFVKARRRRLAELEGVIERIRGLRGMPKDASGLAYRLGRFFIHMNTITMMGSVALTSIPDAGRPVMAHGLGRTFNDSWSPFIRSLASEEMSQVTASQAKELRMAGVAIDTLLGTRARNIFGLDDFAGTQSAVERGAEYLAQKIPKIALFGPWTDGMKLITGAATMTRILRTVEDVANGSLKEADLNTLSRAGISPEFASRIQRQMEQTGTKHKDILLPNTEAWDDYQALRVFQAALAHEDARMVITPGLEKPLWMDASLLGRMVAQFRSFIMAANTKMLIAGLQTRGVAGYHTLQGVLFSLALGAVSYYAWAMSTGQRQREEMRKADWGVWLDQAIYRSGLLGVFSEAQSIASAIPGIAPFTTFSGAELAGRRAGNIVGKIAGPTFGKARDIEALLQGIDEPTQATISQARKLLPLQNVFYLRQLLNEVEEGISNQLNLPERRQ